MEMFLLPVLRMFRSLLLPGRCALAILALTTPLFPTALLQLSLADMTRASTEIVQGTVTGASTSMSGNTVFTHYTVSVSQRWKGANNPVTDVAVPGGAFGGLRQSYPGVPVLQIGQQYVLFLWQGKTGPNQPVGFTQGVFQVGSDGTGQLLASRPASSETMLDAAHKPVLDHAISFRVSQMRARVAAIIAGGAAR